MIKEVIVVEGRHDTNAIKRAIAADTIETGGSAISPETIQQIRLAQKRRGVIVFTDPDYAGERIRKIITKEVPGVKHAFITQVEGEKKGDIGVENASPAIILRALEQVRTSYIDAESQIAWQDLIQLGLVGGEGSAQLRERCAHILGIGYGNGKQFFQRLRLFRITQQEFIAAYERALEGMRT